MGVTMPYLLALVQCKTVPDANNMIHKAFYIDFVSLFFWLECGIEGADVKKLAVTKCK